MRVFQRPEHEWLRLACMADCDPAELEALTREPAGYGMPPSFDWDYIMSAGGPQQADGVAAWRSGRFPQWRAFLDSQRGPFMAAMERVVAKLRKTDMAWVAWRFPSTYIPLGLSPRVWPRKGKDIDIFVSATDYEKMVAFSAREFGTNPQPATWEGGIEALVGGVGVELESHTPEHVAVMQTLVHCDPLAFEGWVEVDVYGVRVRHPRPEILACVRAHAAYFRLGHGGEEICGALPLMDLAAIHNAVTSAAAFDWSVSFAFLRRMVEIRENALESIADAVERKPELVNPHGDIILHDRMNYGAIAWVVWVWELTERVYPGTFPSNILTQARALVGSPLNPMIAARDSRQRRDDDPEYHPRSLTHWKEWPGDERFLFELRFRDSVAAREEDGVWEVLGRERRCRWLDRPKGTHTND